MDIKRQVALSLEAEMNEMISRPFFHFFMRDLLVKYSSHPEINVLHSIKNLMEQKHHNLDLTLMSNTVFQINDDDILNEFMNHFHFPYMDTKRMLADTQEMLADIKVILDRIM